ncbi:sugar-binding transcriptional regulator [Lactiplantibacillus daowaiensis]|uniref:Sugar-binding transcriptional regulator n=1 Tax=Lactiplantibacillus daowaiensis TaxID=2559918 RepID=A0ABW1S1L2_9LACO|nr:sugar-binding domain-containing protein [Lactiplantibacillus daowaiensis]
MSKFDIERVNQLIEISKLYYEDGLNQTDISKQVHIHRTEISRLLKEARELGIVKINIDSSFGASEKLSAEFKAFFGLKKAIVVPTTPGSSYSDDLKSVGMYAGNYLQQQLTSNSVVGLSWGRTLATVINSVDTMNGISNVTSVPLIGGPIGKLDVDYQANNLVHILANRIKESTSYTLDSPVMISSPALRKELLDNPNNKAVTDFWKKLNVAIFGIGSSKITNNLAWRGFYKDTGFEDILQGSAVGDILSQPFTIDGQLIKEANGGLVGMELAALKNAPLRIGVATGENKAEAILGALRSETLNVLVTSDKTAVAIKKLLN